MDIMILKSLLTRAALSFALTTACITSSIAADASNVESATQKIVKAASDKQASIKKDVKSTTQKVSAKKDSLAKDKVAAKKASALPFVKVSINKASKAELMTLKGIGEKKAQAILAYRKKHGKFTSIENLKAVKGLGDKFLVNNANALTL